MRNGAGDYTVTFAGSYPASVTPGALVASATGGGDLIEASAVVLSASATSISVEVFAFTTTVDAGTVDVDGNCSVFVQLGQ